ncbi:SCL-interrupting locus protein [Tachyglossus aculeatus]|uniref:SCL-interrupting locus protein n=1 Tax=Tachyglossus aculeatus TaxID=9261 RepID=UPI0018F49FD1|nr:SCL-interrupting locus protein [Tachyglossus aculeatus]
MDLRLLSSHRPGPLSFPRSRCVLWDPTPAGDRICLHLSHYRNPKLLVTEKAVRLAYRHARQSAKTVLPCFLLGTLTVDEDEEGVTLTVDRFDPGREVPGSPGPAPSAPLPGDFLVPCSVSSRGSTPGEVVVHSADDFSTAFKGLHGHLSSKDSLNACQLLSLRAHLRCSQALDRLELDFHWAAVTLANTFECTPVKPIPIIPTALARNLTTYLNLSQIQGTWKCGFLTMDETRKLLLLLESDPKVYTLPLVGIWLAGITHVYSPQVWACCLRYTLSTSIQERVLSESGSFVIVLYSLTHPEPEFYECVPQKGHSGPKFQLLTSNETFHLFQDVEPSDRHPIPFELSKGGQDAEGELFRRVSESILAVSSSQKASPGPLSMSDQDSGMEDEDLSPRPMPSPHPVGQQSSKICPSVPELSLVLDGSFLDSAPAPNHLVGANPPSPPSSLPPPGFSGPQCRKFSEERPSWGPGPGGPWRGPTNQAVPGSPPPPTPRAKQPPARPPTWKRGDPRGRQIPGAPSSPLTSIPRPPTNPAGLPPGGPPVEAGSRPHQDLVRHRGGHRTSCPRPFSTGQRPLPRGPGPLPPSPGWPIVGPPSPSGHLLDVCRCCRCHGPAAGHPGVWRGAGSAGDWQAPGVWSEALPEVWSEAPAEVWSEGPVENARLPPQPGTGCPLPLACDPRSPPSRGPHWGEGSSSPAGAFSFPPPCATCTPSSRKASADGMMGLSPEAYRMLTEQDRQLKLLQAQIERLLAAQSLLAGPPVADDQLEATSAPIATRASLELPGRETVSVAVSTGTSLLWQAPCGGPEAAPPGDQQDASVRSQDCSGALDADSARASHDPDPGGSNGVSSEETTPAPGAVGCSSMGEDPGPVVLPALPSGESVSVCLQAGPAEGPKKPSVPASRDQVQPAQEATGGRPSTPSESRQLYQDLLGQVKHLLNASSEETTRPCPEAESVCQDDAPSGTRGSTKQRSGDPSEKDQDGVLSATLKQLKSLGVTLDSPSHVRQGEARVEHASVLACISPAAVLSGLNYVSFSNVGVSGLHPSGADLSMEANAIALKYLSESQLAQLSFGRAAPGPPDAAPGSPVAPRPTDWSLLGLSAISPSNMSFATRTYMKRYGLLQGDCGDCSDRGDWELRPPTGTGGMPGAAPPQLGGPADPPGADPCSLTQPDAPVLRNITNGAGRPKGPPGATDWLPVPRAGLLAGKVAFTRHPDQENQREPALFPDGLQASGTFRHMDSINSVGTFLDIGRLRQLPKLF